MGILRTVVILCDYFCVYAKTRGNTSGISPWSTAKCNGIMVYITESTGRRLSGYNACGVHLEFRSSESTLKLKGWVDVVAVLVRLTISVRHLGEERIYLA